MDSRLPVHRTRTEEYQRICGRVPAHATLVYYQRIANP